MTTPYTPRTSGAQLASLPELFAILRAESPRRAIRSDFLIQNPHVFSVYHELSQQAGSDDSWTQVYDGVGVEDLLGAILKNHAELLEYIESHDERELYERLYESLELLSEESESDAIFVYGAPSNARIEKAIELYKKGIAPRIIISGKGPHYGPVDTESEARRMAKYAVENGVPADAILVEAESISLPDNVKRTVDLLEAQQWYPATITTVVTNLFMTRSRMEWYRFASWNPKIKSVAPPPVSSKFTAEGWHKDPEGRLYVLGEFAKLVLETKTDSFLANGSTASDQ